MGKQTNGILAPFTGKVGPITGRIHNKTGVIQSNADYSNRIWSPAQIEQRNKFKLTASFIKSLYDLVYTDSKYYHSINTISYKDFYSKNFSCFSGNVLTKPFSLDFAFTELNNYTVVFTIDDYHFPHIEYYVSVPKPVPPTFPNHKLHIVYYHCRLNLFYNVNNDIPLYYLPGAVNIPAFFLDRDFFYAFFTVVDVALRVSLSPTYTFYFQKVLHPL